MKKRLLLLFCLLVTAGSAAWAEIAHGDCKNGSWVIDDSGKLTVNIDGKMYDYGEGKAPWYKYCDDITAIHIGSGCKNVGRNGFYGLTEVESVTGGENVEACAMYSFQDCGYNGNGIPSIYFPKCDYVGECAFSGCRARAISLPLVETWKVCAIAGDFDTYGTFTSNNYAYGYKYRSIYSSCNFIDLGSKTEKLRPGSLIGPNYVFCQSPTPPEWERLYDRNEVDYALYWFFQIFSLGHVPSYERDYEYPFGDNPYVKVIVPQEYLQTYKDYYPSEHPEVSPGYMCAYYTNEDDHSKKGKTSSTGYLVAGAPIYKDGKFIGGWYVDSGELYVCLSIDTMPVYGNDAPWKDVLGSVTSMNIYAPGEPFTIPDQCFCINGQASPAIRGIKNLYFDRMVSLKIGNSAFRNCKELEKLRGYRSSDGPLLDLTVGNNAFEGCTNLFSIFNMKLNSLGTSAFAGCTSFNPAGSWEVAVSEVPESAFENCKNLDKFELSAVRVIGANAFKNSGLDDACLNNIQTVGNNAFEGSGISVIKFGPSTISGKFGTKCFANCKQLGNIYVSSVIGGDASIPGNMFDNVSLSTITLHAKPEIYGSYYENHAIFKQMKVDKEFAFPQGGPGYGWEIVDGVQDKEQHQATLRIYSLFSYLNSPQDQPWYNFREYIREINIDNGVTAIGPYLCAGLENVVSVMVPYTVKYIGDHAFDGCTSLKNISIAGAEEIGTCAFQDCSSLEYIDLGINLKKAGNYIFRRCHSLNYIGNKDGTPAEVTSSTFADIGSQAYQAPRPGGRAKAASNGGQSNVTLQVPDEYATNYIVDKNWGKFHIKLADGRGTWVDAGRYGDGTWILYEDSVMIIAADKGPGKSWEESNSVALGFGRSSDPYAALNRTKRVEFTGNMKRLEGGFNNFPNLKSVSLCPSIKTIDGTFAYCPKLTQINLENVDTIGDFTFECTNIDIANLPNARYIGRNAFYKCHNLRLASLGQPCELKQGAFLWCPELTAINLAEAQLDDATKCFGSCYKLKAAVFTGKYLPEDIFANTFSLTHIDLGEHLDSIDANAFRGCSALDTIYCACPTPPAMPWGKRKIGEEYYDAQAFYGRNLKNIHLFVPAGFAPLYRKAEVWKDMTIEVNDEYVEDMLPTGGTVGEDGSWYIDMDGTLTIDFERSAWTVNYCGKSFQWHDLLASWTPFITKVIVSDRVNYVPYHMAGEHDPAWSADVKSIELGARVTNLQDGSLNYSGIKDVYCYAESCPSCSRTAFDWDAIAANNATLHVVASQGVLERYQNSQTWSKFPNIVADLTSRMPAGIFSVTNPESLVMWFRVTDEAAKTCETYHNDIVGKAIEYNSYGHYEKITVPATVTYNGDTYKVTGIGDNSFYGCTNVDTFILPEGLERIGVNAFNYCFGVHEFTLPASVTEIAEYAFEMWTNIERFTVNGTTPPTVDENFMNTYWDPDLRPKPTLLVPDGCRDAWNVEPWNKWFNVVDPFNKGVLTYKVIPGASFYDYYQNDEEYMCIEGLMALGIITYQDEMVGREWDELIGDWNEIWGNVYYNKDGKKLFYLDDESRIQIFDGVSSADNIYYEFKASDYETMMYTTGRDVDLYKGAAIVFPESNVQTDIYFTATNSDGIDITYRVLDLEKKTCEVKADPNGYNSNAVATDVSEVKVPFSAGGYIVTGVAADAFNSLSSLQSLTLPMSIRTIGANAFGYCENVVSVFIDCEYPPMLLDQDGFLTDENNYAFENIGVPAGTGMGGAMLYVPSGSEELYNVYPWNYWFSMGIAPDPDGIASPKSSPERKDFNWFDLSGRKLTGKPTMPGLYIKGGKKVVVK